MGNVWNQALKFGIIVHLGEPKIVTVILLIGGVWSFAQIPLKRKVITATKLYLILAYYTVIEVYQDTFVARSSVYHYGNNYYHQTAQANDPSNNGVNYVCRLAFVLF